MPPFVAAYLQAGVRASARGIAVPAARRAHDALGLRVAARRRRPRKPADVALDLVVDVLAHMARIQVVVLDGLPARDVARAARACRKPEPRRRQRRAQGRYSWRLAGPRTPVLPCCCSRPGRAAGKITPASRIVRIVVELLIGGSGKFDHVAQAWASMGAGLGFAPGRRKPQCRPRRPPVNAVAVSIGIGRSRPPLAKCPISRLEASPCDPIRVAWGRYAPMGDGRRGRFRHLAADTDGGLRGPVRSLLARPPACCPGSFCFLAAPEGRPGACAWALRGSSRQTEPTARRQRSTGSAAPSRTPSQDRDHRDRRPRPPYRQGPRHHLRHHPARRRAVARRLHDLRGEAARSPTLLDEMGVDIIEAGFPDRLQRRLRGRVARSPGASRTRPSPASPAPAQKDIDRAGEAVKPRRAGRASTPSSPPRPST